MAREATTKINKWDYIKPKSFCVEKDVINKTKMPSTERENTFANCISDKGLIPQIYQELIKLKSKRTKHPVKK